MTERMLSNFKKFGRSRPDTIHESGDSQPRRPNLNTGSLSEDKEIEVGEEYNRASEPLTSTRNSFFKEEKLGPVRHQTTSASSFVNSEAPQDELGLRLVHDSDSPIADLIFVHGLGGSAKKTWSFKRDTQYFWPPWLGSEVGLSNTRIFTFGYNSKFAQQSTTLSILDFAKELLFQAKTYQHAEKEDSIHIGENPIIFVVHSMGGLVVKKAYIIGKIDDHYREMMSQTYGIVFLGTPHRGSSFAQTLNNILRISPLNGSKIYVSELEKGSVSVQDINEQFRHVCGELALVSFYETLKTSIAPGVKAMIVEQESAILGYPTETSAPLHADHNGLTKFSNREDRNYRDVRNVLRMFVRKVKELEKHSKNHIDDNNNIQIPAITVEQILGIKDLGDDLEVFKQRVFDGSCQWIFQKKRFRNWVESNGESSSVFWLTGLPAVGKTVLSSFIIDYLKQGFVLGSCQYHYFQAEHHDTRKITYFLRSLALQVAQQHDVFKQMLLRTHVDIGMLFATQKYQVIWDKIFEGILFRLVLEEPLIWVLDGLDEAELPAVICTLMKKINSATPIKVLLVSRNTQDISTALTLDSSPILHEDIDVCDTASDIQIYVNTAIGPILPDTEERAKVVKNLLSKANGSFLWIKLALERVKDSWHTAEGLQHALEEIPEGMDVMYERMAENVAAQQPPRTRELAVDILTWAACAFRPLSVEELAVALKPKFGRLIKLEVTISQICGNFIAIKKSNVTLIHQTARKFLLSSSRHLAISINSQIFHGRIARVCMEFLSDSKWRAKFSMAEETLAINKSGSSSPVILEPLNDTFLWYATTYWSYHVSCASVNSESEELQTAIFEFLEGYSLVWIHAVALSQNLRVLTSSAQWIKSYTKRKANYNLKSPTSFTSFKSSRDDELQQWANDLIRVVGRFGSYLAQSPSSIHKHIIPFCPTESMLSQTYGQLNRKSISVKGILSGKWDDCLARLTMGGDETASKVICQGNYFVTLLSSSGTLVVWYAETCGETRRLAHGEWVTGLKASKQLTLVASAGIKTTRVWDIVTGKQVYTLPKTNQGRVMAMAFTSNDTQLLIAYDDCSIRCFDLETSIEKWCFYAEDPSEPNHSCPRLITFSQDNKQIAIAYRGRPVLVWRISSRKTPPMRCIRQDDIFKKEGDVWNAPEVVLWQPESSNVLILYQDTILVDWNIEDDTQAEHAHIGAREMVISADGNLLLTSDHNGTLSVWSTGSFRMIYQLAYDEFVRDIAFSPNSQRIYDTRGTICNVWEPDALIRSDDSYREDLTSTHESATILSAPVISTDDNGRVQISALVCDNKDAYYCSGKEDGSVVIYDMETAKSLRKLYGHSNSVSIIEIVWSKWQKYIASVDDSGRVIAKRLEKPGPRSPDKKWKVFPLLDLRLGTTVTQVLFSQSEKLLLVCSAAVDRIYCTATKVKLFQVEHRDSKPRIWVQHPTEQGLLICIRDSKQIFYHWDTLEPKQGPGDLSTTLEDLKDLDIGKPDVSNEQEPECVLLLRNRYLIFEIISHQVFNTGRDQHSASRHVEIVDLNGSSNGEGLQRRPLPLLARNVNRLIGVVRGRLLFLDHQYWLCTWELSDDESDYRRHFFLPKDWLSPGALKLVISNEFGTLLCPKNGEVAVVRSGIKL